MARKVPVPWVSVAADGASKMAAGRRLMNGAKQTAKGANPVGWGLFGGVMFMETYDHYQMVQQFRKPTQDYLEAATGDKELAKNLSMIDGYGHGTDARLRALAAYRGVSPRETFDWFADVQKKNPAFAGSFASHLIRDLHPRRPKVGEELTPDDFVWDDPSDARHIPLDMRIWGPGTLEAFSSYADRRGFPLPRRVY
jgi:hypothetical protein